MAVLLRDVIWIDVESGHAERSDLRLGADSNVPLEVDCSGVFALPGLVDMHVHVAGADESSSPARGLENLVHALRAGITTVRDLGTRSHVLPEIRRTIATAPEQYPLVVSAGQALTAPGGHGSRSGIAVEVADEDAIDEMLDQMHVNGSEVVKVMAGSGSAPLGFPDFSPERLRFIVDRAHALGLPVAIHANFRLDHIEAAVAAGCDTLEHGTVLCDVPEHDLQRFGQRGGAYCPTLSVLERLRTTEPRDAVSAKVAEAALATVEKARASVDVARRHGIAVLAGTDSGAKGLPFGTVANEVRLLHEAGLSRLDAIRAATTVARRYLPARHTSAPANGDALLLRTDPRDDLEGLEAVHAVVRNGHLVHIVD